MDTLLWHALKRLTLPGEIDAEVILKAILDRETLGSSFIGAELAIPHCRHPSLQALPAPLVSLNFPLQKPTSWGREIQRIRAFFLILCPDDESHLALISRLSSRLRDGEFLRLLNEQASPDDILDFLRLRDLSITNHLKRSVSEKP